MKLFIHSCTKLFRRVLNKCIKREPTTEAVARAWKEFKPKVPFSYVVAVRNAVRRK
jgi:hypothetical protein